MKCQRCKHDIMVHWMKQIGEEPIEYALGMSEDYLSSENGDPWPEYRCNCAYGTNPLISYDDYVEIKDTPLYGEYGTGLDIEPYYVAMVERVHRSGDRKRLYGNASTNEMTAMMELAHYLVFSLNDDDRYGVYKGKLYHIHQIIDDYGRMQELMPGASPLVDPEAPEELYTFDDDVRYYVVNLTEEI